MFGYARSLSAALVVAALMSSTLVWLNAQQGGVAIDPDDIGGVVSGWRRGRKRGSGSCRDEGVAHGVRAFGGH